MQHVPHARETGGISRAPSDAASLMTRRRFLMVSALVAVNVASAAAQDYRIRIDARAQSVSFRGLSADSIRLGDTITDLDGTARSPEGQAVRCFGGPYCYFFRSGPVLRGVPVTLSASIAMWGLGVEGLSLRTTGRYVRDLGKGEVWPGTEPTLQLVEGYLAYERWGLAARAGRQLMSSRLEHIGFDGGWLRGRWERFSLEFTGYGGWGLGQAAAVSPSSPALNPLDEWRPHERQLVAGAEAAWLFRDIDVRAEYRREIDRVDRNFVSERTALSFGGTFAGIRGAGGFDYNIAEGHWGSADLKLSYLRPSYSVAAGVRRYQPYFSLWTLWGAFSPVPYNATNLFAQVRPASWLQLRARSEWYRYADAGVSTALVPHLQDHGWRASGAATATLSHHLTVDAGAGRERGPGASTGFADASLTFAPTEKYSATLYGGTLERPLELRYYDAQSRWIGGRGEWQMRSDLRLWSDVARITDKRERTEANGTSLAQFRMRAGVSAALGSGADRTQLPPARRTPK